MYTLFRDYNTTCIYASILIHYMRVFTFRLKFQLLHISANLPQIKR